MSDGNGGEPDHNILYTYVCVTVINKEKGEQINENRKIISNIAQIGVCSLLSRSPKKQSTQ